MSLSAGGLPHLRPYAPCRSYLLVSTLLSILCTSCNMAEEWKAPHVLIVGAGIVGLLIAQGLKKNNIPFEIFEIEESESHYRPR